ncbi:cupin [Lentibacillus sp. Marseille-P4043]|uniref:cupin n=1 Tax=Lentibacillus sp. Marseille-P4043 TaxID=2040293 RepID=UPI000D0BDFA8|nr:cupin [Lentibacillus sp. Marseille-P4043]
MEIFTFSKESGNRITKFNSDFIMNQILQTEAPVMIECMHLDENGVIGYHQAVVAQLLLVLDGEGEVCGESGEFVKVHKGHAIFWSEGEWHETVAGQGLTAIVIQGKELKPGLLMKKN